MLRKFTIEIREYESGRVRDQLTEDRIESAVIEMLMEDDSDGVVIVREQRD